MKIELLRQLVEEANRRGIFFDFSDTPEDLMLRILILFLQTR